MSDLTTQLMEFRTTYLKAIARAAVDVGFRRELTKQDAEEGNKPLDILNDKFDYVCPWELELELQDHTERGPRVNIANGTVMTRPYCGESITVYIPDPPERKPEMSDAEYLKLEMEALAAYYDQYLYFFLRPKRNGAKKPPSLSKGDTAADSPDATEGYLHKVAWLTVEAFRSQRSQLTANGMPSEWSSVNTLPSQNSRFSLGTSPDDFLSFAAAMFNAVALAWHDEKFKELLTRDPDKLGPNGEPWKPGQTIRLLEQWLGYKYPWELELIVLSDAEELEADAKVDAKVDAKGAAKYGAKYDATKSKWTNMQWATLTLTLPWMSGRSSLVNRIPDLHKSQEEEIKENNKNPRVTIMGLALYNTDGPGYPFTCG